MKYIISSCGFDIAVGLLDANTATEDINLANNILGTNHNDNYYNGVIIFNNMKHFYRFLINKYYIRYWQPNKSFSQVLKKASNKTRQSRDKAGCGIGFPASPAVNDTGD